MTTIKCEIIECPKNINGICSLEDVSVEWDECYGLRYPRIGCPEYTDEINQAIESTVQKNDVLDGAEWSSGRQSPIEDLLNALK